MNIYHPQKLETLIDYQPGSIVSKAIIKQSNGNVTLFAFDKGEGLSEHRTPFDAMAYLIDGEVEITIADQLNVIKKGELLIMPADKPHALKAKEKFKMMLVMIKS